MNIYKVVAPEDYFTCNYGEYIEFIAYANSEEEARLLHPNINDLETWVKKEDINQLKIEYLGENKDINESYVITAYYREG